MDIEVYQVVADIDYIGDIVLLLSHCTGYPDEIATEKLWKYHYKLECPEEEAKQADLNYEIYFLGKKNKEVISLNLLQKRFSNIIESFEEYQDFEQIPSNSLAVIKNFLHDDLEKYANYILQVDNEYDSYEAYIRNEQLVAKLSWNHYA